MFGVCDEISLGSQIRASLLLSRLFFKEVWLGGKSANFISYIVLSFFEKQIGLEGFYANSELGEVSSQYKFFIVHRYEKNRLKVF